MPNPFSNDHQVKADPETQVTDIEELEGLFECTQCYEGVRSAKYYPKARRLVWICSQGHENEERGVDFV